jgi:hypothetical protein
MSQATISLNAATSEAIKAFAKTRKISSSACVEAAELALSMQAAMAPRATRQAGDQSVAFRNAVVEKLDTLKGQTMTFAQVAKLFGIDPANAVNNLRWLKEHQKINFNIVGKGVKPAGQRGRAPMLIEFV